MPSWEFKLAVEAHMHELGLPLTVLRPMAFMELMTDKEFFPPVSAWIYAEADGRSPTAPLDLRR